MSKCCCSSQKNEPASPQAADVNKPRYFGIGAAALALWAALYSVIQPLSRWLTQGVFRLDAASPLGAAVEFFF